MIIALLMFSEESLFSTDTYWNITDEMIQIKKNPFKIFFRILEVEGES